MIERTLRVNWRVERAHSFGDPDVQAQAVLLQNCSGFQVSTEAHLIFQLWVAALLRLSKAMNAVLCQA